MRRESSRRRGGRWLEPRRRLCLRERQGVTKLSAICHMIVSERQARLCGAAHGYQMCADGEEDEHESSRHEEDGEAVGLLADGLDGLLLDDGEEHEGFRFEEGDEVEG